MRDVGLDRGLSLIFHRAGADRLRRPLWAGRNGIVRVRVGPQEFCAIAPVRQIDWHKIVRARLARRRAQARAGGDFDAIEAMENVAEPGAIVDLLAHRLAELAVVRNRNAGVPLTPHNVRNG